MSAPLLLARALGTSCVCGSTSAAPWAALSGLAGPATIGNRGYANQGEDGAPSEGMGRRRLRPARHGSKLALRDPERFQRMRAILGYPTEEEPVKSKRVTISTLQTMKYLMVDNREVLEGLASYKVTSLNRELLPLLQKTRAALVAPSRE